MVHEFSRRTFLTTTALAVGGAAVADVPARAQQSARSEAQPDPSSRQLERGMRLRTVGIMSPGDMGSAVGQVLAKHGFTVIAALGERSARTRALAAEVGIADVGTLENQRTLCARPTWSCPSWCQTQRLRRHSGWPRP